MGLITVKELMTLHPLAEGVVVAGNAGLDNQVDSVSVIEVNLVRLSEGRTFASGKALDISSMYSMIDNIEDQVQLIKLLKEKGNSGLVLCHVGIVMKEVAPELIAVCNALDFPLIVMPANTGFREIIVAVTDALRGLENFKLSQKIAMYDSITELLMKDQTAASIIDNLSKIIRSPVVYFDRNLKTVDDHSLPDEHLHYIREQVKLHTMAFMDTYAEKELPGYYPGTQLILMPLYSNILFIGVIAIVRERPLSEMDRMALLQTGNALAIVNLKRTDIFTQRARFLTEYIDDLVHGYSDNERVILNRAKALNHKIEDTVSVVVVDIFRFEKLTFGNDEREIQKLKNEFSRTMDSLLRSLSPQSIGCNISDKYVVLFTEPVTKGAAKQRLLSLGRNIQEALLASLGISVSIGIGSVITRIAEFRNSYESARDLIRISNSLYKEPRIVFPDLLPVYLQMLKSMRDAGDRFKTISYDMLASLTEYDNKNNASLAETYKALVMSDMNTTAAAQQLYLHKNTVLQRKQKIIEIMGYDPFEFDVRMQFLFLFVINKLLNNPTEE